MLRSKRMRRLARRVAPAVLLAFAWSCTIGTWSGTLELGHSMNAASEKQCRPYTRNLTPNEMRGITGGTTAHRSTADVDSGSNFAWEAGVGGVNTINGNKLTQIPLFGWTARGGLPIQFTLAHNSYSTHNSELGQKWTHSLDIYLVDTIGSNSKIAVHWGDDLAYHFTKNMDGTFSNPTGIYDTFVGIGSPYTSFDLTTKDQVKYHFTKPNSNGWMCTSITDANSNSISLSYNGSDYLTTVTDPTSRTISISYDGNNRISSVTDAASRSWSMTYTSGKLTQVTWPTVGGNSYNMQFSYSSRYDITTLTDKRANNWTFTYGTNSDMLASATDPASNQTSYSYDFVDTNTVTVTDANSHAVVYGYDTDAHRVSSMTDALNNTESYSYDSSNNRTGMTDRRSHSWSWTFDSSGNVLTASDPLSHTTTLTWNSKNRLLTVTDALSHYTGNTYDSTLNYNLTQTQQKTSSGGSTLSTTTFTWNSNGTLASKTDSNSHATTYGYSTNGDLTSVTTPNSRVTSWTVNTLGARTSRTDALSNTTNYTLDGWYRVTTIDYPTGTDPTLSYDANDNLTGWTDGVGTWSRAYDSCNRITSESLGGTTRCSYSHDATGKKGLLSSVTDANSRTITYAYTNRNELYSVAENSATTYYTYDANGNETGVTLPNTATVTNVFDNANRLTSVTNKNSGGTTLSSFTYSLNDDNTRASCTESNGDVVSYGYDGAHRLTSESRTGSNSYSYTYTVDGVGNRTSQVKGGTTTNFTLNTDDELTATSGGFTNSYSYNNAGDQTNRTLSGTSWTVAYDYEGQLTSTATGGNTISSFVYDALGRRYSRANGGTTTVFYYGPGGILTEKQGSTFTAAYAYGNGLIRKDGEYPMFDGLGSERTVTNSSQTVTGTITFEGFGATIATTGSSGNPYKFAANSAYRDDGDAGLLHVGARYYDPQVGRFITRDTQLDQHPYLYCGHDPVNHLDPSGHDPWPWIVDTFNAIKLTLMWAWDLIIKNPKLPPGNLPIEPRVRIHLPDPEPVDPRVYVPRPVVAPPPWYWNLNTMFFIPFDLGAAQKIMSGEALNGPKLPL